MEYIGELEKNLGKKAKFRMLPMQPGDVPETSADTSQLYKATGYRPQVGIAEGVARFVEWYRDFYGR